MADQQVVSFSSYSGPFERWVGFAEAMTLLNQGREIARPGALLFLADYGRTIKNAMTGEEFEPTPNERSLTGRFGVLLPKRDSRTDVERGCPATIGDLMDLEERILRRLDG